jgi:hypothetical protein
MELLIIALVLAMRFALRRADARRCQTVSTHIPVWDVYGVEPGMPITLWSPNGPVRIGTVKFVNGDTLVTGEWVNYDGEGR